MKRFLRDYRAALIALATTPIPDPWYCWDRAVSWIAKRRTDTR